MKSGTPVNNPIALNIRVEKEIQDFSQKYIRFNQVDWNSLASFFSRISPHLNQLSYENQLNSLKLMNQVRYYDYNFVQAWARNLSLQFDFFSPEDLSRCLSIFANCSHIDNDFFRNLTNRSLDIIENFSIKQLSYIGEAFSKLKLHDPNFFISWLHNVSVKLNLKTPSDDLTRIIAAIAKSNLYDEFLINEWMNASRKFSIYDAFCLSMILVNNFEPGSTDTTKERLQNFIFNSIKTINYEAINNGQENGSVRRQLLEIHAALSGQRDGEEWGIYNESKASYIDRWNDEFLRSPVSSSYTQSKVSNFIKRVYPELTISDEVWVQSGSRRSDIGLEPIHTLVEVNGLTHYYIDISTGARTSFPNATTIFHQRLAEMESYKYIDIDYREVDDRGKEKLFQTKLLSEINPIIMAYNQEHSIQSVKATDETIVSENPSVMLTVMVPAAAKKGKKAKQSKADQKKSTSAVEYFDSSLAELKVGNAAQAVQVLKEKSLDEIYNETKKKYGKSKNVLFAAVLKGEIEDIKVILEWNKSKMTEEKYLEFINTKIIDPNNNIEETLLEKSFSRGVSRVDLDIAELLVAEGITIKEGNSLSIKAFVSGFIYKKTELCQAILDHMPESPSKHQLIEYSFLIATSNNYVDMMEILLERGVDKNVTLPRGKLSMWRKLFEGDKHENGPYTVEESNILRREIASVIYMPRSAKSSRDTNDLSSILERTAYTTRIPLNQYDINTLMNEKLGLTALHSACYKEGTERAVKYLLEIGATPNTINSSNVSPLFTAIHRQNKEIAEILLDYNPNTALLENGSGTSMLHMAAQYGYTEIARKILNIGEIDINARTTIDNLTALKLASHHKNLEIVKFLIAAGADISDTEQYPSTRKEIDLYRQNPILYVRSSDLSESRKEKIIERINMQEMQSEDVNRAETYQARLASQRTAQPGVEIYK